MYALLSSSIRNNSPTRRRPQIHLKEQVGGLAARWWSDWNAFNAYICGPQTVDTRRWLRRRPRSRWRRRNAYAPKLLNLLWLINSFRRLILTCRVNIIGSINVETRCRVIYSAPKMGLQRGHAEMEVGESTNEHNFHPDSRLTTIPLTPITIIQRNGIRPLCKVEES